MALIAQLRHDIVLAGDLHHLPHFVNRMRQWLFAVDMLAATDNVHNSDRVRMVGRPDNDRVDLRVQLVEHLAKVAVTLRVRVFVVRRGSATIIHVGQRDDILTADAVDIVGSPAARTDGHNIQLVARRRLARPTQHMRGDDVKQGHAGAGRAEKLSAADRCASFLHGNLRGHEAKRRAHSNGSRSAKRLPACAIGSRIAGPLPFSPREKVPVGRMRAAPSERDDLRTPNKKRLDTRRVAWRLEIVA